MWSTCTEYMVETSNVQNIEGATGRSRGAVQGYNVKVDLSSSTLLLVLQPSPFHNALLDSMSQFKYRPLNLRKNEIRLNANSAEQ